STTANSTAMSSSWCASRGPAPTACPNCTRSRRCCRCCRRGAIVALVTDGSMSGASGQVPEAIHVSPEAASGGAIAKLRDGDVVRLDADAGTLGVRVDDREWRAREAVSTDLSASQQGMGRELFALFRDRANAADAGGGIFHCA